MKNSFGKFLFGLAAATGIHAAIPSEEARPRAEQQAEENPKQKTSEDEPQNELPKKNDLAQLVEALPRQNLPPLRGEIYPAPSEPTPASSVETRINPFLNADHAKAYLVYLMRGIKRDCIDKTLAQNPSQLMDGIIGLTVSPGENWFNLHLDEFGDMQKDDTSLDTGSEEDAFPETDEETIPTEATPEDNTIEKGWNGLMEAKMFPDTETMELSPTQSMDDIIPIIVISGTGSEMEALFREYLTAIKLANDLNKTEMSRAEIKKIMEKKFEKHLKK